VHDKEMELKGYWGIELLHQVEASLIVILLAVYMCVV
jgi:hypothetical protein